MQKFDRDKHLKRKRDLLMNSENEKKMSQIDLALAGLLVNGYFIWLSLICFCGRLVNQAPERYWALIALLLLCLFPIMLIIFAITKNKLPFVFLIWFFNIMNIKPNRATSKHFIVVIAITALIIFLTCAFSDITRKATLPEQTKGITTIEAEGR